MDVGTIPTLGLIKEIGIGVLYIKTLLDNLNAMFQLLQIWLLIKLKIYYNSLFNVMYYQLHPTQLAFVVQFVTLLQGSIVTSSSLVYG